MLQTFLYGELAYMPNLEKVLDEHITDDNIVNAVLDDYTISKTPGGRMLAVESTLSSINGLIISLDPEQIKILMAYYGKDFRFTNVIVKNGLTEKEVKTFLYIGDNNLYKPEYTLSVDKYIENFCFTFISDEQELDICNKTLAGLFPEQDVEWLKNSYPAYVKWLRDVCFAKEYMFDSIQGIETPEEYLLEIIEYLFNMDIESARDLCINDTVPFKMMLQWANKINSYWKLLTSNSKEPSVLLNLVNTSLNFNTQEYATAVKIMDTLKEDFSESIKALESVWITDNPIFMNSLLFCILKYYELPLIMLKTDSVKPLEACVCNNLYLKYLR